MGETNGKYGREVKCMQRFGGETRRTFKMNLRWENNIKMYLEETV